MYLTHYICPFFWFLFFFNDTATTEIYTLSLHDALPIFGFEIEGRLGRAMNPRHYRRGWHCTSTLGTIGSAAACARLFGLDRARIAHALAIAASSASGLKENFGTMVKPLHAGLSARSAVLAAELARAGMTASAAAID